MTSERRVNRRIRLVLAAFVLVFAVALGRAAWLQVVHAATLGEKAQGTWGENSLNMLAQIYENRQQYDSAADYWKKSITKFGPGANNWKQQRVDQILGNWGQFEPGRQPARVALQSAARGLEPLVRVAQVAVGFGQQQVDAPGQFALPRAGSPRLLHIDLLGKLR